MAIVVYHFADSKRAERIFKHGLGAYDDLAPMYRVPRDIERKRVGVELARVDALKRMQNRVIALPIYANGEPTNVITILRGPVPCVGDPDFGIVMSNRPINIWNAEDEIMFRITVHDEELIRRYELLSPKITGLRHWILPSVLIRDGDLNIELTCTALET